MLAPWNCGKTPYLVQDGCFDICASHGPCTARRFSGHVVFVARVYGKMWCIVKFPSLKASSNINLSPIIIVQWKMTAYWKIMILLEIHPLCSEPWFCLQGYVLLGHTRTRPKNMLSHLILVIWRRSTRSEASCCKTCWLPSCWTKKKPPRKFEHGKPKVKGWFRWFDFFKNMGDF